MSRGTDRGAAATIGLIVTLFLLLNGANRPMAEGSVLDMDSARQSILLSSPVVPLLQNPLLANVTSALYAGAAANLSAPTSCWATISNVDTAVLAMYGTLNATSTFDNLWTTWGTGNFTFTYTGVSSSGIANATYGVFWDTWTSGILTFHYEYWIGVLTYHASPSGPLGPCTPPTVSYTLNGPYTESGAAMFQATLSYTWSGLELDTPGLHTLTAGYGMTNVPKFSTPSTSPANVPSGKTVDPVAASWYGLTDKPLSGGASYLAQTGFIIDTANPYSSYGGYSPYSVWYELWPAGSVNYVVGGGVASGDTVVMGVSFMSNWYYWWNVYYSFVYDVSRGLFYSTYMFPLATFAPKYAEGIVEAPTPCGGCPATKPMQLPVFEIETFHWVFGIPTVASGTYSAGSLYSGGNFNDYYIEQSSSYRNTYESLSVPGNSDTVAWYASDYDYTYV